MKKDLSADGLRGIAALSVVFCHALIAAFPLGFADIYPGAAAPGAEHHMLDGLVSLPLVSIFWDGNFAVCVFFVLSGYVLTKPFVESGDTASMRLRAARRYLRLCIPVLGSVALSYLVLLLGWRYSGIASELTGSSWLGQFWRFDPSFSDALKQGAYGAMLLGSSSYTPVLWTMKVEFIGSLLVFGYRAISPPGSFSWLNLLTLVLVLIVLSPDQWMLYLSFIAGSYLGELPMRSGRWHVPAALILALYFGGFTFSHWYAWMQFTPLSPAALKNLSNTVGAIALLYAVRLGFAGSLLESVPAQFLGKISYSLYLVHFPVLLSLGALTFIVCRVADVPYTLSAMLMLLCTLTASIPLAVLFRATFDLGGIKISRLLVPALGSSSTERNRDLVRGPSLSPSKGL